jgi:hypothetical protein
MPVATLPPASSATRPEALPCLPPALAEIRETIGAALMVDRLASPASPAPSPAALADAIRAEFARLEVSEAPGKGRNGAPDFTWLVHNGRNETRRAFCAVGDAREKFKNDPRAYLEALRAIPTPPPADATTSAAPKNVAAFRLVGMTEVMSGRIHRQLETCYRYRDEKGREVAFYADPDVPFQWCIQAKDAKLAEAVLEAFCEARADTSAVLKVAA